MSVKFCMKLVPKKNLSIADHALLFLHILPKDYRSQKNSRTLKLNLLILFLLCKWSGIWPFLALIWRLETESQDLRIKLRLNFTNSHIRIWVEALMNFLCYNCSSVQYGWMRFPNLLCNNSDENWHQLLYRATHSVSCHVNLGWHYHVWSLIHMTSTFCCEGRHVWVLSAW